MTYLIRDFMAKQKFKQEFKEESRLIVINLRQEIEHLKQLDFKDEDFQFLVLTEWLKKPVEIVNPKESVLSRLNWYNAGVFVFTVLPFITGALSSYISFRLLTYSDTYTSPAKFTIRSEKGKETIAPKLSNMMFENDLHVDNKLLMHDLVLKSRGYSEENYITMILQRKQKILKVNFKFITDDDKEIAKEYEELKSNRFYDLVDLPYVTPNGARFIIKSKYTFNYNSKLKKKKGEKLKLHEIEQVDPEWLADYNSMSEYWS